MKYYHKEILSNEARLGDGRPLWFEDIGDGDGILKTDDQTLIDLIKPLTDARRGGVREITADEFEEYSKKKAGSSSPRQPLRRMSDPPAYPNQPMSVDRREAAVADLLGGSQKRFGFGGAAPEGATQAQPPPTSAPTPAPTAPSGDPVVNRPTPKKVSPKQAAPEGNLFP